MKRHWLRGLLLGVSLALLLSSGVALAQGLFATVDKGVRGMLAWSRGAHTGPLSRGIERGRVERPLSVMLSDQD